jgi:hypothetical protein
VIRLHHDDPTADWMVPGAYEVDTGLYRIPLPLPHDHYTMAVALCREFGLRISLGREEAGTLRLARDPTAGCCPLTSASWPLRAGCADPTSTGTSITMPRPDASPAGPESVLADTLRDWRPGTAPGAELSLTVTASLERKARPSC